MSRPPIAFVDLKAQYRRLKPEIDARIQAVLDHGQYVQGPEVAELEGLLGAFVGGAHAVGVGSGTDALLMGLLAYDVGPGDAVFVPAFTFPATAEVPLLLRAEPVFVDVEPDTFNIDPDDLDARIEAVAREGRLRPRVVIPVDMFGLPADHARVGEIAARHGMEVLDDAAQALGATRGTGAIGTLARITATSFFPAKPLGAYGDAGAVFTTDEALAERLRSIRVHGQGSDKYEIARVGINGRLDTLQAAVLIPKLGVLGEELKAREELADFYDTRLRDAGSIGVPVRPDSVGAACSWAQYTLQLDDRERVIEALRADGVPYAIHYPKPMHLQRPYLEFGSGPGSLPVSESVCDRVLSLPMHPYMETPIAQRVVDAVLRGASGA